MNFVIDENVPVELISWLNQKGHNTFFISKGSSDEKVASFAKKRKCILLTLDRHFGNTLRFPPKEFPGIIRIKIHPPYIEEIIFSLNKLFNVFVQEKDFQAKLLIIGKYGFFKLKEE